MKFSLTKKFSFAKNVFSLADKTYREKAILVWKVILVLFGVLTLAIFFAHLVFLWRVNASLEDRSQKEEGVNSPYLNHAAFENALTLIREKKERYDKSLGTPPVAIDPSL